MTTKARTSSSNKTKVNKDLLLEFEIQKEKTRQLELIKEIKKLDLKAKNHTRYKKHKSKSAEIYNALSEVYDEDISSSESEEELDTISMCSTDSEHSYCEVDIIELK